MELRHLRYFLAVATEAHVTRAAERLGVAQPALTQQIRTLEAELGVTLWRRAGRNIELTEAGQVLQGEATAILNRVQEAVRLTRKAGRGESGRVVVGYIETASYTDAMARIIAACRQHWPAIELQLTQNRTTSLIEALIQRQVDIAFVRPPVPAQAGIGFISLEREGLFVALPRHHPLAEQTSVEIAQIADEEFIGHARLHGRTGLHDLIENACAQAGFVRRIAQFTPQFSSSLNLVASSMGISIVPACMRHFRLDEIVYLPLVCRPPVMSEIGIAYRNNEKAPAVLNIVELAQGQIQRRPSKTTKKRTTQ